MMKVSGDENKAIYSGKEVDETYLGDTGSAASDEIVKMKQDYAKALESDPKLQKIGKEILVAEGKKVYTNNCSMCHQLTGEGISGVFPPLAKSDYLQKRAGAKNREEFIAIPRHGLSGPIKVNNVDYNSVMPGLSQMSDDEVAAVLSYITNSWGNSAAAFSVEEVKKARSALESMKSESDKKE